MSATWVLDLEEVSGPAVTPCSVPSVLDAARALLGAGPVRWAARIARESESKVVESVPELAASSIDTVRRPAEACTLTVLCALYSGTPGGEVEIPVQALAGNRDSVHRGIALDRVLRAMWISHVYHYEKLLAFLQHHLGAEQARSEIPRVTALSFAYVEAFTTRFSAEYTAEREAWLGSLAAIRRQVIEDLVSTGTTSVRGPDRVLGVDLSRHHQALIVWTDEGVGTESARALDDLARELATATGAGMPLIMRAGGRALWMWLSWSRPPEPTDLSARMRAVRPPAGVRAATGPVAMGVEGFRRSHLAALEARRVVWAAAYAHGSWLAEHRELDVVALLTADPEQAHRFVVEKLGQLAAADERCAGLRKTLRLYLAFERSRSAAAQVLHVAPNTVGYRVRQAEGMLPGPIHGDALRVRLALELYDYLPAEP